MNKAREDYRTAVLALTEEYQVPVDAASEWRARALTAGNRLDAAVMALMVATGIAAREDSGPPVLWLARPLLKGEELEKP